MYKNDVLSEVLDALGEHLELVVAGGAARDIWHGRTPTDFDIFVLNGSAGCEPVVDLAESVAYTVRQKLPGATDISVSETYNFTKGSLAYVVQFHYKGHDFDIIEFMEPSASGEEQVQFFDVTLNMAWLERSGDSYSPGGTAEFFGVVLGNQPVTHLPYIDGDVDERMHYLRVRYPQYTYRFLENPFGTE